MQCDATKRPLGWRSDEISSRGGDQIKDGEVRKSRQRKRRDSREERRSVWWIQKKMRDERLWEPGKREAIGELGFEVGERVREKLKRERKIKKIKTRN